MVGDAKKTEKLRCLKYGSLIKLCRCRFPKGVFPDDTMGRVHLFQLVCVASLAPACADQKVKHLIDLWAPWMPAQEVDLLKEHLGCLTITERWHTPSDIGRILYCSNAEREAWALWQILPCDMTDEELAAFRTNKRRKQLEKRRRDKGIKSRAEYLAEIAKPKPWEAEGIHRRTWERRNAARSDTSPAQGLSPIIVFKEATHPAASVQTESQKKGLQGSGATGRPVETAESEHVESQKPSGPHGLESEVAASADDERLIALSNWGKNAEQKKSTLSAKPKKPWSKPMFSEELRDFAEFPLEANELAIKEAS
jgi:hypothetical protein